MLAARKEPLRIQNDGACEACGNTLYIQYTVTSLRSNETMLDESARERIFSERVMKVYECMACHARYIRRTSDGVWVTE